jgi:hypothetical protein
MSLSSSMSRMQGFIAVEISDSGTGDGSGGTARHRIGGHFLLSEPLLHHRRGNARCRTAHCGWVGACKYGDEIPRIQPWRGLSPHAGIAGTAEIGCDLQKVFRFGSSAELAPAMPGWSFS